MTSFIDEHRGEYGVEPICRVLPIAPSTYHERVAQRRDPSRLSPRAQRDEAMKPEVQRVFDANFKVYGYRKVWRQMQREGFDIARCTVERLMRELGLQGVIRGKPVKTTMSDKAAPCPDVVRVRLCRLRDRRLRPLYRGLAGEQNGACQLCTRCPEAGGP